MKSTWTALENGLRAADEDATFADDSEHPITQLVNKPSSAKPYKEILIAALDQPLEIREREMVVRSLSEKGITEAIPRLFGFLESREADDSSFLWAVGNAIHTIAPKDHLPEALRICRDRSLGSARQMVVIHAARFKKNDEVFDTLVSLLDDSSVRGHALEALWRFGNPRALAAIEATPVTKGLYEAKAKKTAVRRLQRKLDNARAEQGGGGQAATRSEST